MEGTTKLIETYQNEDLMSLLRLMAPDKKGDDDNYPQIDFIIYLSKRDFPIGDILDINTYDIQGSNSTTDVTDSIESTTCDIETLRSLPQHPLDRDRYRRVGPGNPHGQQPECLLSLFHPSRGRFLPVDVLAVQQVRPCTLPHAGPVPRSTYREALTGQWI